AGRGRTVLFVSHNLAAVEHLCQKAMILHEGKLVFNGTTKEAIDYYVHSFNGAEQSSGSYTVDLSKGAGRLKGYLPVRPLLQRLELFTDSGKPMKGGLAIGASVAAHIHFRLEEPTSKIDCALAFYNLLGQHIFTAHSAYQPDRPECERMGNQTFICDIPSLPLVPGEYVVGVGLVIDHMVVDLVEDATRLTVIETDYYRTGKLPKEGAIVLKHNWYFDNFELLKP
ncbi:unnamed protein product, partial [marine sediment metagenome]